MPSPRSHSDRGSGRWFGLRVGLAEGLGRGAGRHQIRDERVVRSAQGDARVTAGVIVGVRVEPIVDLVLVRHRARADVRTRARRLWRLFLNRLADGRFVWCLARSQVMREPGGAGEYTVTPGGRGENRASRRE